MTISFIAKNVEITDDIKELAEEKISKLDRFLNDISSIELIFIEEKNPAVHNTQVCEATIHIKGTPLKAHGAGLSFHEALDKVANKLVHQAQKLKDRRVKKYQPRRRDYNNQSLISVGEEISENDAVEAEFIKTKQISLKPMSQEEAALQMDLLAHDFFLYVDDKSKAPSVIYRRKDGNLGILQGGQN